MSLTPKELSQVNWKTHYVLVREDKNEFESAAKETIWGGLKFLVLTKLGRYDADMDHIHQAAEEVHKSKWLSEAQYKRLSENWQVYSNPASAIEDRLEKIELLNGYVSEWHPRKYRSKKEAVLAVHAALVEHFGKRSASKILHGKRRFTDNDYSKVLDILLRNEPK
jgi:hypothetical protein